MWVFLVLAILSSAGVGVYIAENRGGSLEVSYLGQHWFGVDAWIPLVAIAGTLGLLLILSIVYASARIALLRRTNRSLRDEVMRLRGVAAKAHEAPSVTAPTPERAAQPVASDVTPAEEELTGRSRRRWLGLGRREDDGSGTGQPAGARGRAWMLPHASTSSAQPGGPVETGASQPPPQLPVRR
jgi:hypothetical protein